MAEGYGRDTPPMYAGGNEESRSAGQPLSDFLLQLEDYTPTVYKLLDNYEKRKSRFFKFEIYTGIDFSRFPMLSADTTFTQLASILQIRECERMR